MFLIAVSVGILLLLVCALAAIAIGALAGVLISYILRHPRSGISTDGVLGLFGFLLGSGIYIFVAPVGDFFSKRFLAPFNVAFIAATLLPCFRELRRFIRFRITSAAVNRRLQSLIPH